MGYRRGIPSNSERNGIKKAICNPSQLLVWHKIRSKSVVIRRGEDPVFRHRVQDDRVHLERATTDQPPITGILHGVARPLAGCIRADMGGGYFSSMRTKWTGVLPTFWTVCSVAEFQNVAPAGTSA